MKTFDYVRPATVREAGRRRRGTGRRLSRRRHQSSRSDEGRRQRSPIGSSTSRIFPASTGSKILPMAACASARWFAMPILPTIAISPGAFRPWPKRFCPAPRRSCAMPRPSAAISCSARAAPISTIRQRLQQTQSRRRAATPAAATTGSTPYWAGARAASRRTRPISVLPLVALDAVVEIEGKAGRREIPLETFHRLPGDTPDRETMLEPGEMIVAVRLPAEAAHFAAHARYLKVRDRTSYAFAIVSAAAALRIEADVIAEARIALGGVALKPWRAREAEQILIGARADAALFHARRRGRARRRQAVRRQCLQDRARTPRRGARARARRRRHARAHARAARLHPLPPFPEFSPMPEIALTQTPVHVRHGSNIGQPLTRRDGVLKVTGAAKYAADQHPPGMLYAVLAVSEHRARPRRLSRCRGGESPSGRRRGDHAGEPAGAGAGSGREIQSLHVPARSVAKRSRPLCRSADRGRDRRNARSRDRRRRAACAALRGRAGAGRARCGRKLRAAGRRSRLSGGSATRRRRGRARRGDKHDHATYETAAQYHNPMEPHAIVAAWDGDTLSIDTPSQGLAMAQGASCRTVRHFARRRFTSAVRSSAAASAARA